MKNLLLKYSSLLLVVALSSACSHISYSRVYQDTDASPMEKQWTYLPTGEQRYYPHYRLQTALHEIVLADRSGVFCAALFETMGEEAARAGARKRAAQSADGRATYSWREHHPAEYAGNDCGIYARWGDGDGIRYFPNDGTESSLTTTYGEGGLHYYVIDHFSDVGNTRFLGGLRFSLARYTFTSGDEELPGIGSGDRGEFSGFAMRLPFWFGFTAFPDFLYGFGAEVTGGMDIFGMLLTSGNGNWYEKFEYGARVGYVLPLDAVALSAYFGYNLNNSRRGDFWDSAGQWTGTINLDMDFDLLF